MAKKKMKAQPISRAISAKELKFWLEGILEFQDDNWVPNREQWKNIQDKIFNLQETPDVVQVAAPSQRIPQQSHPQLENVFLPNGGAAGLSAPNFPEGTDENPLPPIGVSSIAGPAGPMPVRDQNGFLRMPDAVGVGESYVPASSGARHKLKHGFE